ncbi:DUF4249 domain-containing protein [Flectobacillus major]|uniref:DUF4249 domain-containing protein n=1 Tax=Flectobacillus major TaxID=103 RepID=UPI000415DEF7|nr:DUF4249 domain-containing protein [Flectobacillus major]
MSFRKYLKIMLLLACCTSLQSCVDPYEIDFEKDGKRLVVEGFFTDNAQEPDTIKIYYSSYSQEFAKTLAIEGIKAFIQVEETKEQIALLSPSVGRFVPPKSFVALPNQHYRLLFSLPNGDQYQSTAEQLTTTPPIAKVHSQFNLKSKMSDDGQSYLSAHELYVDYQDIPNKTNFYLWRYTHYERLQHCKTCNNSILDYGSQQCVVASGNLRGRPYFDYGCEGLCYAIFHNPNIIVQSDRASDGRLVQNKLVAQIPYYYDYGCLVNIEQISVSLEVYKFYKLVELLSSSSGGLADTPPSAIVGNIQNITNPDEKVVGFFGVANIQKQQFWLDRTDATGKYAYILGHLIVEEPSNPPTRPPFAACVPSDTRTPIQPKGWKN